MISPETCLSNIRAPNVFQGSARPLKEAQLTPRSYPRYRVPPHSAILHLKSDAGF